MWPLQLRHQRSYVSQRVNTHACIIQHITSHVQAVCSERSSQGFGAPSYFFYFILFVLWANTLELTLILLFPNLMVGCCACASFTCGFPATLLQVRSCLATRGCPRVHASVADWTEMWRWVSGELPSGWAGLMCSQQTAADPSSARLNWAPGFVRRWVYLQYGALYKAELHRGGHCREVIVVLSSTRARMHDTRCCWANLRRGPHQEQSHVSCVLLGRV